MGLRTKNDHFLLLPPLCNEKKLAYKAYFWEIYGHLLKNSLLFLYKFSEAYVLLNIPLGPISPLIFLWDPLKVYHFWILQMKLSNFSRSTPLPSTNNYIDPYDAQAYFQYRPIFAKFRFNSSQLHCLPLPASYLTELTAYQTM